jgi:hypothetical protein
MRSDQSIEHFSTIVVLEDLLVGDGCHTVVVKLEPPAVGLGLDKRKVVTAVQIARMDEDAVEVVDV